MFAVMQAVTRTVTARTAGLLESSDLERQYLKYRVPEGSLMYPT